MKHTVDGKNSTALRIVATAVIATALIATGCGKKKQEAEAPAQEKTATPVAQPVKKPALSQSAPTVAPPTSAQPEAQTSSSPLPVAFRVGAIIDRGDGSYSAGLVSDQTGYNAMVRVGDTFEGYAVEEIDAKANRVYLMKQGQRYVAGMAPGVDVNPGQLAPQQAVITAETVMPSEGVQYEPTEDEIKRGIDPNDPATWPLGYRGPGIERAGVPETKFEATPDEVKRGIDPNNPETWPSDYRGPGIERALQQMQQQQAQ